MWSATGFKQLDFGRIRVARATLSVGCHGLACMAWQAAAAECWIARELPKGADDVESGERDQTESRVFYFDRARCIGWSLFCLAVVVMGGILALAAPEQRFAAGLVPGWLFGSFGSALFTAVGISWLRRALHRGPALQLTDAGVVPDRRLGGVFAPRLTGLIPWVEVDSAFPGPHGAVVLRLRDPQAFWARQTRVARIMAWRPGPHPREYVGLGGNDLEARQPDVVEALNAWAKDRRLASQKQALPSPEAGWEEP